MSTAAQEKRRRKVPTTSVRIHENIANQADIIASARQLDKAAYLSDKLRELVQRDYDAVIRELAKK